MSKIISVQEALKALANGEDVQSKSKDYDGWSTCVKFWTVNEIMSYDGEFRLKPRTITLNGFEVPVPFEPKIGDDCHCYYINTSNKIGYDWYHSSHHIAGKIAWRTEEEVKQVVEALRSIFK